MAVGDSVTRWLGMLFIKMGKVKKKSEGLFPALRPRVSFSSTQRSIHIYLHHKMTMPGPLKLSIFQFIRNTEFFYKMRENKIKTKKITLPEFEKTKTNK